MHDNLIILAAGASSRMKNSVASANLSEAAIAKANSVSKTLIGLGNEQKPILEFLLENSAHAGYNHVYIVVQKNAKEFRNYFENELTNKALEKLNIQFAIQHIPAGRSKPYGTADAVLQVLTQYPALQKDTFTVCNGDNLYSIKALKALRKNSSLNALISYDRQGLQFSLERILAFALLKLDTENYLLDIVEKPTNLGLKLFEDSAGSYRVSMNIFKLNGTMCYPFLLNCPINPKRQEKELPTVILNMCKEHPKSVLGIPFSEHVPDLTSKEDIVILNAYIKEGFPKK